MHYFSAAVKRNFRLKAISLFLIFTILTFEHDDYYASALKLIYLKHNINALLYRKSLFVQVPNIIEV